eukprot:CAMPEP_0196726136 /NCGR_PEP_ID=MMETSP1091-20130531/7485_1 /TAXON_ID=302021 /ORGANISM="Rhodomonas sp., Strain CCMP768" /LENGTH=46 /DNA_ID= /DNA_START= /DNA_END= /DNA_ORIENTATION=
MAKALDRTSTALCGIPHMATSTIVMLAARIGRAITTSSEQHAALQR